MRISGKGLWLLHKYMTRDECKQFLVERLSVLGGARMDEFAAFAGFHRVPGFSQIFHPEMISQLVLEGKIVEVKYVLPGKNTSMSFLLPKNTKVSIINA